MVLAASDMINVPRRTQDSARPPFDFAYGTITHYGRPSQVVRLSSFVPYRSPTTLTQRSVWPLPRSLAATQGIHYCFLFLQLLRCFNWLGSLNQLALTAPPYYQWQVFLFGDPRIVVYLRLPEAFRC